MSSDDMLAVLIVIAQAAIIWKLFQLVATFRDYTETTKLTLEALREVAHLHRIRLGELPAIPSPALHTPSEDSDETVLLVPRQKRS